MKTNLYFVRHAQPDYSNHDDQLRPLTPKGVSDVRRVTEALKGKEIGAVYSSPFKRAYEGTLQSVPTGRRCRPL